VKVGVVIPAYQAEPSVAEIAARSLVAIPGASVLVVDDGSTDRTAEEARRAGATVVSHPENRGKGAALRTGCEHWIAQGYDGVVTLDADGQHLPEEIGRLLEAAATGADLVLGVRDHYFEEMSPLRRRSNRISSDLISRAARHAVSDVQTGFRFYSRRLIEEVGLRESGFEAESAVFVRAARRGLRIVTTPIRLGFSDGRCTSHYRSWVDGARIARAVVGAMLEGKG